jgi:hypothetical protein
MHCDQKTKLLVGLFRLSMEACQQMTHLPLVREEVAVVVVRALLAWVVVEEEEEARLDERQDQEAVAAVVVEVGVDRLLPQVDSHSLESRQMLELETRQVYEDQEAVVEVHDPFDDWVKEVVAVEHLFQLALEAKEVEQAVISQKHKKEFYQVEVEMVAKMVAKEPVEVLVMIRPAAQLASHCIHYRTFVLPLHVAEVVQELE